MIETESKVVFRAMYRTVNSFSGRDMRPVPRSLNALLTAVYWSYT